jgi:hypothetical protein
VSSQLFPEEAYKLFTGIEEPLLQASLGEQQALLQPFLGGFGSKAGLPQQYGQAAPIAAAAGTRGAQQAGIANVGQVQDATTGLTPELLNALSQLVLQRGSQITGAVGPGYTPFFAPSQVTRQGTPPSKAQPIDPFATGAALGSSLTQIGSTLYTDTGSY